MIRCWLTQTVLSWNLDAGRSVSQNAQKHLERCPGCRHFYQTQTRLIRELSQAAPSASASPFLQSRILHALETSAEAGPGYARTFWPSTAKVWASGVAVLALVAAFVFLRLASSNTEREDSIIVSASLPMATNLARVNGQELIALGSHLETPLKREMQYLVSDAKNAINSLAMTCLPANSFDIMGSP